MTRVATRRARLAPAATRSRAHNILTITPEHRIRMRNGDAHLLITSHMSSCRTFLGSISIRRKCVTLKTSVNTLSSTWAGSHGDTEYSVAGSH